MADDDDDDAEGEGGGEPSGGGGGKKKLFIIIGAAVFVLLGVGAGLFFTGLLDPLLGKKTETVGAEPGEAEPAQGGKDAAPTGPVAFFDMPEMIITLNTATKAKAAFMKIRLSLEVPQSSEIPKVQAAMPRIVDNLQGYLRELRVDELKGSAGAYRLKEEILTRIKLAVAPAKVNAVLFKELQVQ
jgi:flagellar FliL protein